MDASTIKAKRAMQDEEVDETTCLKRASKVQWRNMEAQFSGELLNIYP